MYKKEKELKIVLKKVGENPEVMNIENTLERKQELVGGLIEVVPVLEDVLLVCNEEGKLENLLPNLIFPYDYIAGDCFFVGDDYKNGDFKSLTDEQITEIKELCKKREYLSIMKFEDSNGKEFE